MVLQNKYGDLLKFGEQLQVKIGYVKEEGGKLKIGGVAKYQLEKDMLWDKIKSYSGWEQEIEAEIKVENADIYGVYTVQKGDTLSKISKQLFGTPNRYMEIFNMNKDILTNPDLIKIGQKLKLPFKG